MYILGLSEDQFWAMTPRKLLALLDAYHEYKNPSEDKKKLAKKPEPQEITIDQAPSWW